MPLLRRRHQRQSPSIPIVSMADIAFLLIIFFMVSTTFVREKGLQLQLPGAQNPDELAPAREVHVSIDRSRQIWVDDQPVPWEKLHPLLTQKLEPMAQKVVVVRADQSIDWGTVVRIMDVPKTIERETGWTVGLNVAVEELPPSERGTRNQ